MEQKPTILAIEDDYETRHLIETVLSDKGYIVVGCESAELGLKRIPTLKPSLILLDIQLPGMNGLDFCRKVHSDPLSQNIPIIFLSSHNSEVYKIAGLESGADDFITKPFSIGEMIARIKAVLRRAQKIKNSARNVLQDDLFSLDLDNRVATLNKKTLSLTPKEFHLLEIFLRSNGQALNREVLSTQVWERENLTSSRTIDVHIARLRQKLGSSQKAIQTIGKIGYRYNPSAVKSSRKTP